MTLQQIQKALDLRRGGEARPWEYQVSLQRFTLRITASALAGNFHLVCLACERLEFDTTWSPIAITIERCEFGFVVYDRTYLRVECGVVAGQYNVMPLFDCV